MQPGIMELDLHGKNAYQARVSIDAALRRASSGVYRLRLIHPVSAVGTNPYLLRGFFIEIQHF